MIEFKEKVTEIQEKVKSQGIVINRIPKKTKDDFIAIANEEFAGDYGLLMKWCLEQALEYQSMKVTFFENIDLKLNQLLEQNPVSQEEQSSDKSIRTISGRRIVKGGNKK